MTALYGCLAELGYSNFATDAILALFGLIRGRKLG
jgi:hypothetical protein